MALELPTTRAWQRRRSIRRAHIRGRGDEADLFEGYDVEVRQYRERDTMDRLSRFEVEVSRVRLRRGLSWLLAGLVLRTTQISWLCSQNVLRMQYCAFSGRMGEVEEIFHKCGLLETWREILFRTQRNACCVFQFYRKVYISSTVDTTSNRGSAVSATP